MRIRLRAPDESDAAARPPSAQASPHTPHRPPQLDVRSPELIEQRLENLKRKQSWLSYLDQYVHDHPDPEDDDATSRAPEETVETPASDGDEDEEEEDEDEDCSPGFLKSIVCSVAVVALSPLWVVAYPCLRNKGPEFWPLGCSSLWGLYKHSVSLLVFVGLGVALMYYALCKELPEWSRDSWYVLQVEVEDLMDASKSCQAAVLRNNEVMIRESCAPIAVDGAMLLTTMWATMQSHRRWGRALLIIIAAVNFYGVPGRVNQLLQPSTQITGIEQPYALLDEEILVAFEGKNLLPGGTIAWVSYWGCASTSPVSSCEMQFPSTFDKGFAPVTFTTVDHFIPCYRNPPNPLKAEEFRCFEQVRLAVKEIESIPGWSRAIAPPRRKSKPGHSAETGYARKREKAEGAENDHVKSFTIDAATGDALNDR